MNIIALCKVVYDGQDITVQANRSLSFEKAGLLPSLYDLNAIEAATQLKGDGGTLKVLSVGAPSINESKLKKNILSRGADELVLVCDDSLANIDTHQTASILAASAKKLGYDLILCGEGSADSYNQQVGIQVGELLNIPVINAISKITLNGSVLEVERTLENTVEVLEVSLPAVICVSSDINQPRIPSMKDILGAGKKPAAEWKLSDIGISLVEPGIEKVSALAPEKKQRQCVIFEGEDKVPELYEQIKNLLK